MALTLKAVDFEMGQYSNEDKHNSLVDKVDAKAIQLAAEKLWSWKLEEKIRNPGTVAGAWQFGSSHTLKSLLSSSKKEKRGSLLRR